MLMYRNKFDFGNSGDMATPLGNCVPAVKRSERGCSLAGQPLDYELRGKCRVMFFAQIGFFVGQTLAALRPL